MTEEEREPLFRRDDPERDAWEKRRKKPKRVTIVVSGGLVQDVYSNDEVEVNIVDFDQEGTTAEDAEIDEALCKDSSDHWVRVYQAVVVKAEFLDDELIELLGSKGIEVD